MAELLHQLIGSLSHYLQGSVHPRWLFGISAINSMILIPTQNKGGPTGKSPAHMGFPGGFEVQKSRSMNGPFGRSFMLNRVDFGSTPPQDASGK